MHFVNICSTGHPLSLPLTEKFRRILNSFLTFRDEQEAKLKSDPSMDLGDVTTVNCNMVRGKFDDAMVEWSSVWEEERKTNCRLGNIRISFRWSSD